MNNTFSKKMTEIFGKMDEKILEAKLNKALEMIQAGDIEQLAGKIGKIDKEELLAKMNDFDGEKLKELNIDKNEINKKLNDADLHKVSQILGDHGEEIVSKIKEILK